MRSLLRDQHGTRACYHAGCRCAGCRAAASHYQRLKRQGFMARKSAEQLARWLQGQNLTHLASRSGVSDRTLTRIRNGQHSVTQAIADRVCLALGLMLDDIEDAS